MIGLVTACVATAEPEIVFALRFVAVADIGLELSVVTMGGLTCRGVEPLVPEGKGIACETKVLPTLANGRALISAIRKPMSGGTRSCVRCTERSRREMGDAGSD